jgi:hypothetical protein
MEGLGRVFNVIAEASGKHVKLEDAASITFTGYENDGSTIVTIKESIDGASEQNLVVLTRAFKAPGIGGSWTAVTQTAAATYDNGDDGTNDQWCINIGADELSATYNTIEATVDGGTCIAIVHDLAVQRAPQNLASSVV